MPGFYGTSDDWSGAKGMTKRAHDSVQGHIKNYAKGKKKRDKASDKKADFVNRAKLMKYQVDLDEWQQTQMHGTAGSEDPFLAQGGHMGAASRQADITDAQGNVVGNKGFSYSVGKSKLSMGGSRVPAPKAEKSDEGSANPWPAPRQFPGRRVTYLGADIPIALSGVNSSHVMRTTRTGRQVPTAQITFGTGPRINGEFPMANEARIYKQQQAIQEEQGRQWHDQMHPQQPTLFDEDGPSSEATK